MDALSDENLKLSERLDTYLARLVPFGFSGALLVAEGDTIILNEGYGLADRKAGIPNTRDTVFSLSSITKQFTATAILKLETLGKLRAEDAIAQYLPGVPADKADVTLHHLLTHTAGLINYVGDDYDMLTRDTALKTALEAPLQFPPGSRYEYSNAGYTLLAAIVEIVSGEDYETFLHTNFFEPAGMAFTGYRMPHWEERTVAHFHVDEVDQGTNLDKPFPSWSLIGSGEMLSTTLDMYRWHQALMSDQVLPPEAKRKLYQPFLNNYGYGWRVDDTKYGVLAEHGGATTWGSSAYYRRYLDADLVFILFCNEMHNGLFLPTVLKDKISALVFGETVELPPAVPSTAKEELVSFAGERRLHPGGCVSITARETHLQVLPLNQQALDALFPQMREGQGDFGQRTLEILEAAKHGDYQPLANARTKERPLEGALNLVKNFLEGGSTEALTLLGTVPSGYVPDALDTLVTTEAREQTLLFVWKDGINVGCGVLEGDGHGGLVVPCLPVNRSSLVGYHAGAGIAVQVKLEISEG